jgi:hypothetical protein
MSVIRRSDTSIAHPRRQGPQFRPPASSALRIIVLVTIAMLLILVLLPAAVGGA